LNIKINNKVYIIIWIIIKWNILVDLKISHRYFEIFIQCL
jgi:hypothetical protein